MKDKYRVIVAMMIFMIGEYVVEEKKKKKKQKSTTNTSKLNVEQWEKSTQIKINKQFVWKRKRKSNWNPLN